MDTLNTNGSQYSGHNSIGRLDRLASDIGPWKAIIVNPKTGAVLALVSNRWLA